MRLIKCVLALGGALTCYLLIGSGIAVATPKPALDPSRDQPAPAPERAVAIFAGGCFWCMESPFDKTPGVLETISGYSGGKQMNPTYEQVSSGTTGHYESVKVVYDPKVVTYEKLLDVFWHNIDPVDTRGQFCDKGSQYKSVIFTQGDAQKQAAEKSRQDLIDAGTVGKSIATKILPASHFYPAEDYHQDYYIKNPIRYQYYRGRCGRDARLEELWGKAH